MSFVFKPVERSQVYVTLALAGPSGGGKTYSALLLAKGLAGGDIERVAFLDTEHGRGTHHRDLFAPRRFLYSAMEPPFESNRFVEAAKEAHKAGARVLVIDTMSHQYAGPGGLQEQAALAERGIPKVDNPRPHVAADWKVRPLKSPANWAEPKEAQHRMMQAFQFLDLHIVFCLRAEEKIKLIKQKFQTRDGDEGTKIQVAQAGFQPICEKGFMYEMTASCLLLPAAFDADREGTLVKRDTRGVPDWIKLEEYHEPAFRTPRITEESGAWLANWASAGGSTASRPAGLWLPDGSILEPKKGALAAWRTAWETAVCSPDFDEVLAERRARAIDAARQLYRGNQDAEAVIAGLGAS